MALIQKAFSDIITFSRSSNATRIGPTGRVEYAPHNLLLQSQTFDNAAWTKSNATITANAATAPNGTVTAAFFLPTNSSNVNRVYQLGFSANTATHSVYAKASGYNKIALREENTTGAYAAFDLATGTVLDSSGTVSQTIVSAGNGWYRVSMTVTTTTHGVGVRILPPSYSSGSVNVTWTSDGTSGIYIWGAQLSVGPYPLDYTPTTSAAVYGPRFDYDPVTLAARGLLIEEQRTNLLLQSEDISTTWTNTRTTETVNATVSPSGESTADKLVEDSSASNDHVINQTVSVTSSTTYTTSVFLKAGERTWAFINMVDVGVSSYRSWFNLSTGQTGTNDSGNSSTITSVGNGWYRCTVTRATTSSQTSVRIEVGLSTGDGVINYTGNGTSGIYVWGAQLEAGAFSTSYLPTLASSVTRSADVASVNTLSPWFNATEGTLFAESVSYNNLARSASISNSGSSDTIGLGASSTNNGRLYIYTSGVEQANLSAAFSGSTLKEAAAYKTNDAQYCANGTLSSQDTSVSLPTLNKMDIGYFTIGGVYHNGWIRRIAYYPRRLTNAELQALTA